MGGTDEPFNLVELTVAEHAEAHRLLFEKHGHWEDEIAWKGLAGIIGNEEACQNAQRQARKSMAAVLEKRYGPDWAKIIASKGGSNSRGHFAHKKVTDQVLIESIKKHKSIRKVLESVGLNPTSEGNVRRVKKLRSIYADVV